MHRKQENPAALAGADRAHVTKLPGRIDGSDSTHIACDLQVRRIVARYAVTLPLAMVIAQHAFSSGRQA